MDFIGRNVGIYNSIGTTSVHKVEITSSGVATSYGIYNSNGSVNITECKIDSVKYGIYNESNGTINMESGEILIDDGNDFHYGIRNLGTLNIGIKDGNVKQKPLIRVKGYRGQGIYNNTGIVNMYDGMIQGSTKFGAVEINEIEEGYKIKEETIDGLSSIYLTEKGTESTSIVKNEENGKEYDSLKQAINESADIEEVNLTILQNFELQEKIEIAENKNIILNLSGKTITNKYWKVNNKGILTIDDTVGNGKITFQNTNAKIFNEEKGKINLKNGEIIRNTTLELNVLEYGIYNNGQVDINGGKISVSNRYDATYGIYNNGLLNVNNGDINSYCSGTTISPSYAVYNTGTLNVSGGNIYAKGNATRYNYNISYGIYNTGKATIREGKISSDSISAGSYAVYNKGNEIMDISHSELTSYSSQSNSTGVYNDTGTVNLNDVSISCNGNDGCGIENKKTGIINLNSGTIESNASNNNAYGINNISTGIINIGVELDGIVSSETPIIKAEYTGTNSNCGGYGISNEKGKLNFYDGRIEGSTLAKTDKTEITKKEETAELKYENDNKILYLTTEAMEVAKVGDISYTSLQEAINAVGNTKATIELLRGIELTKQDTTITIGESQDITLDLKGFNIISAVEDVVFTNNGKLKITDSTEEAKGRISSSYSKTIQNNSGAILELEKGTIAKNRDQEDVIYNEGTLNVTGATITNINDTVSNDINSIYNTGSVNISSGIVKHKIQNAQNGNITINNGIVSGKILNQDNATIQIMNGAIDGGIQNTSGNTVTITGGTIKEINSTAGTVNIGTKDGNIINEPIIEGNINGIDSTRTLNIYDGTINGGKYAVGREITELEEKSEIVVEKEGTKEKITLVKIDTPIAEVSGNTYYSLKEAIESISETGTVKILREGTVAQTIRISDGKNITLDLNGNKLKMYNKIQNTGNLSITDSSAEKAGNLMGYKDSPIYNSGNLTIKEGNISGNSYGICNQTGGTTNVEGGNIKENTYGIYSVDGTVNVTGGNITGNKYGTFANSGIINISDGTIVSNEYGVYNSKGTMNLSGGNINGNTHEIYNGGTGTINIISGNYVTTKDTLIENAGNGTIVVGTQDGNVSKDIPMLQAEKYAIANTKGTIKFYDGKIKGKSGAIQGVYLYKEDGYEVETKYEEEYYCDTLTPSGTVTTVAKIGTVEYTNLQAAINAATSENTVITLVNSINTGVNFIVEEGQNVVIDLNGKTITSDIEGSTIENVGILKIIDSSSTQTGKVSNIKGIAITNTGTLTLGENNGDVSITCPEISGNTIGIKNTGELNFYDGIIKASVALEGDVSQRATGYIINKTKTNGIEQLTLGK